MSALRPLHCTSILTSLAENAEDRGGALVEPTSLSTSLEGGDVPGGSGISGPGGKTPDVNHPALIELGSGVHVPRGVGLY